MLKVPTRSFAPVREQEVPRAQGVQLLAAMHGHKHATSIVDDFAYYEARAMQYQRPGQFPYGEGNSMSFRIRCLRSCRVCTLRVLELL